MILNFVYIVILKSILIIIGFSLIVGCSADNGDDPFYLLEGDAIEVVGLENEKLTLSVSEIPEETSTLSIDLNELYADSDLKKLQIGDQIIKKSESFDIIIRRNGEITDTLYSSY